MSDHHEEFEQERPRRTRRLPEDQPISGAETSRRTERLDPSGDAWTREEPANARWRQERSGTQRAPKRGMLPGSPQELQLWLQSGGWKYLAGIGLLLVVLLIALLAFSRTEQREAGLTFDRPEPTAIISDPVLGGNLPGEVPSAIPEEALPPPAPQRFIVAGTGVQGLFLRPEPSRNTTPLATLADGQIIEQIGPDVPGDGFMWRHVRTPEGQEGYVAADFLNPVP